MIYFPQFAAEFDALLDELRGRPVRVLGHARPDGDCIGAQVAMVRMLRGIGIDAAALNVDPAPDALRFLVDRTPVEPLVAARLDGAELLMVDCADGARVGVAAAEMLRGREIAGNIDHHISNTSYARRNIVEPSSAATCEILAGLAFDLGWTVDSDTAQALLTGIMTDTGRFCYPATSSRVFALCSRLLECGARPQLSAQSIYENEPMTRFKLLQRFLASLRVERGGAIAVGKLCLDDFQETGAQYEESEGFVDYARSLRGARVGVYLEERQTTVKASLRADDASYRVDRIARQFGGGGHACAAAFSSDRKMAEIEEEVVAAIGRTIDALDSDNEFSA